MFLNNKYWNALKHLFQHHLFITLDIKSLQTNIKNIYEKVSYYMLYNKTLLIVLRFL